MAEGAGSFEPVSGGSSLFCREITGNFAHLAPKCTAGATILYVFSAA
jgi:hypothetical protein